MVSRLAAAAHGAANPRVGRPTDPCVLLGGVFFATLLVLSVWFYKERALTLDGAYYMYRLVQDNRFFYGHGRLGACLTEVLPLTVRRLGGPLREILIAFSVSHVLVYLVPFAVIALGLREPTRAMAIPMLLVVGVRHLFYWVPSELLESLALLVLVLAWLRSKARLGGFTAAGALVALSLLVRWFHLAVAGAVVFALGFDILDRRRGRTPWPWVIGAGFLAFTAWTVSTVPAGSYEGQHLFVARPPLAEILTVSNVGRFLPRYLEVNARAAAVATVVVLFYLVRFVRRADRLALAKSLWVAGCFLGYTFVLLCQFPTPVWAHYFEHISMPLAFIAVVPLTWDVVPALGRVGGPALLGALLAFGTVGIVRAHAPWTGALAYADRVLDRLEGYPEKKFVTEVIAYSPWAFGVQTLLLSSLTRPEPMTVLHAPDPRLRRRLTATPDVFHKTDLLPQSLPQAELDPGYFPLRRTPYREIPPRELPPRVASGSP